MSTPLRPGTKPETRETDLMGTRGTRTERRNDRKKDGQTFELRASGGHCLRDLRRTQYGSHKRADQFSPCPVLAATPLLDGNSSVPARNSRRPRWLSRCYHGAREALPGGRARPVRPGSIADPTRSSTEPLPAGPESVDRLRHPLRQQLAELARLRGASALGDECLAVEKLGHVAELL